MEAPKAPPAPANPLAALLGPAIEQKAQAAEQAAQKRHDELVAVLREVRDLLRDTLGE
jgi:hypothetical protein